MPSRISGACTPCRSKKQKCSGHHPTCSQCANASIDCTWPEQRKRGPAKGYIEALESRLHGAESLLLAILPLISDNVVERASNTLQHDDDDDIEATEGRRSSPPLLNKKTGLDYWDKFPLDNRRNIRKWQFDCEANSNANINNTTSNRRYRSPTRSPASATASTGIISPRNSTPNISHTHSHSQSQPNQSWIQSMQPYVAPNPMQAGAAQQLLNLSNNQRHGREQQQQQQQQQWMSTTAPGPMQLDPHLLQHQHQHPHHQHQHQHQHQPRSMPHVPQQSHVYAGNVQPNIFW